MKKLLLGLVVIFALSSCNIEEDNDDCPVGVVNISVYVERFGSRQISTNIPASSESNFNTRINSLNYYLYRGDELIEGGPALETRASAATRDFSWSDLAKGDYTLVLMANCAESLLREAPISPSSYTIVYPGADNTDDYFLESFSFTVDSDEEKNYIAQLKRVHGIVRCTLTNVPVEVSQIQMELNSLASHSCVTGAYSEGHSVRKVLDMSVRSRAENSEISFTILTFPTMDDMTTSWNMTLATPAGNAYDGTITEGLYVARNEMLDLAADFDGEVTYSVNIKTEWDGDTGSDAVEINN